MSLKLSKAGTSDALTLNGISKRAFDSDIEIGAPSAGGPPGYMSLPFHNKMARANCLYKLISIIILLLYRPLCPFVFTLYCITFIQFFNPSFLNKI